MLVTEVISKINAAGGVKDNMDLNSDGSIDNLTIVVAGESKDRGSSLYPHKANYEGTETIDDLRIGVYNCSVSVGIS